MRKKDDPRPAPHPATKGDLPQEQGACGWRGEQAIIQRNSRRPQVSAVGDSRPQRSGVGADLDEAT